MEPVYQTEIKEIGPEVPEFLEMGLLITFAVGAPPELAEMSVLHEPTHKRERAPEPGDVLAIGPLEFRITAIGEKAWKNVLDLGHAVFSFNGATEVELPGQIYVEQQGSELLKDEIQSGTRIEIRAGTGSTNAMDREGTVSEP